MAGTAEHALAHPAVRRGVRVAQDSFCEGLERLDLAFLVWPGLPLPYICYIVAEGDPRRRDPFFYFRCACLLGRLSGGRPGAQRLPGGGLVSVAPASGEKLYQTLRLRPVMPASGALPSTRTAPPGGRPAPALKEARRPVPRVANTRALWLERPSWVATR